MSSVFDFLSEQALQGKIEGVDPAQFASDSTKAVVRRPAQGNKPRPQEPPEQIITENRLIRRTDPHVSEIINTIVDYIVGTGIFVTPASIPGTGESQTDADVADLKTLIENSTFDTVVNTWVDTALTEGQSYLSVVVEDDKFKPKILPGEKVTPIEDLFGNVTEYQLEVEGRAEPLSLRVDEVAMLKFFPRPGTPYGIPLLSFAQEQIEMLRDMELDMARFISTKAYPPIVWTLGTEDRPWSKTQMDNWLDEVRDIEPETMLAVGHDVEHGIVGTSSTQSQAGMLNLDYIFDHLLRRIHAGMGLPPFLTGHPTDVNRNTSVAVMPKYDRRIQRFRRILKETIRWQVFVSILAGDNIENFNEIPPDVEFGEHSSEEERLDAATAITMFNNGFLTREAAAKRMGINPETELPDETELTEIIKVIQDLAGKGDEIQNPNGGSPTNTGGGADSPGQEVKSRKQPERETPESDPQKDVVNE